jgi:two-component system, cell cycle sensor histidine kinase and response regulator CckA
MGATTPPLIVSSAAAPAGGQAGRILIVEDDANSAFILRKILLRTDYTIAGVTASGEQALAMVRAAPPDLILMDINIQGAMDGVETATLIVREHDVPIIYLTAYSDDATIERARRTAPFAYLLKPYREKEVLITIQMALYKARLDALLKTNRQRLAATLGALDDCVLSTDNEGRVNYLNPAAEQTLGTTGLGALGQPLAHLLNLRELAGDQPVKIERLLQPGFQTVPEHPLVLVTPDTRRRLMQVRVNAPGAAAGRVIILRDVTRLAQLEENIRQAQKLEAVGRLAGGIAHDFNNLLAIINSFAELLLLQAAPGDPREKYYRNIRTAGRRGADLVAQLMTYSRRAPSEPRLVQPFAVATEAHKMLRPLIRENIELELEATPALPLLHIDPGQFEQILVNLCLNARDAIAEEGCISLRLSTRQFNGREAAARDLLAPGEYVQLEVTDTGSGIPVEIRSQIFEPFFTTKEVGKGTGLGLAMVYSLVKQSHGHVEVQSEPDRGSTFTIYLPAAATDGAAGSESEPVAQVAPGGSERVLLVEDDANFAECVKNMLDLHGYSTTTAMDGEQARARFHERPRGFDLLLSDVVLPKLSGPRLAAELRRVQPGLRVLFMSGYDGDDPCATLGAGVARLQKPFSLNALLFRVRSLLDAPPTGEPVLLH